MKRRGLFRIGLAAVAWGLTTGHTPYRQWAVYRRTHLLILTDKSQPGTFELGQRIAGLLAEYLPESRARVTRAPYRERVASLLGSGQLDVALLDAGVAESLFRGDPPFADYGAIPLHTLARGEVYALVARADFPEHHAYQLAATLAEHGQQLPVRLSADAGRSIPVHPGVVAFLAGRPMPEAPSTLDDTHAHPHAPGH